MDEQTLSDAAARGGRRPASAGNDCSACADVATLGDGYAVQQRANALLERSARPTRRPQDRRHDRVHAPLHQRARAAGRRGLRQPGPRRRRHRAAGRIRPAGDRDRDRRAARPRPAAATRTLHARRRRAWPSPPAWPSIELVDDRYDDFATIGGPTQIADNAFDAGVVLGRPRRDWHGLDLAALTAPHLARRRAPGRGPQRRAARPPLGRSGLARHQTLQPGAGVGRRHLRQPGHASRRCSGSTGQATSGSRWRGWARSR